MSGPVESSLLVAPVQPIFAAQVMKIHLKVLQAVIDLFGFLPWPNTWRRPVVDRVSRQVVFSGIEAIPYLVIIGIALGTLFALYGHLWLEYTRRQDLLYPLFATAMVREAAPLFAVMFCLVASGSPIAAELALMKVSGEVDLLRCQGIHPFHYLVVPRAVGLALACAGGAVITASVCLLTATISMSTARPEWTAVFLFDRFMSEVDGRDIGLLILKSAVSGGLIGLAVSTRALRAGNARTEVPLAVVQAMTLAVVWLVVWFSSVTWLSYADHS